MLENTDFEYMKRGNNRVNIFDLLPPINLYNKNENISNYLNNGVFDSYNYYPNIYKTIGRYLYNNFFFNKRDNVQSYIKYKVVNELVDNVFEHFKNRYTTQEAHLLKETIEIIVLDEIERNHYIIKE